MKAAMVSSKVLATTMSPYEILGDVTHLDNKIETLTKQINKLTKLRKQLKDERQRVLDQSARFVAEGLVKPIQS